MSLLTNLVSHWKLDEASGNRVDSHGSEDLTDYSTLTPQTGKLGDASNHDQSTAMSLAIQNSTALELSSDQAFSFACWIKFDTLSGYRVIFARNNPDTPTAAEHFLYRLYYDTVSTKLGFTVGNGSSSAEVQSTNTPSTGTWYFVAVWHDPAANEIGISIDAGTPDTTSWSGGTQGGGTNTYFRLGEQGTGTGAQHDGLIDSVSFWKDRVLTSGDIDDLYNSGSGLDYPFTVAGGQPTIKRWGGVEFAANPYRFCQGVRGW